jgi:hypothetical protein
MTTLPTWVAVAQWVLLFALAGLLLVVYRQLAYLMNLKRPVPRESSIPVGSEAPPFTYRALVDGGLERRRFLPADGRSGHLLVFADPYCGSCERLLEVLAGLLPSLNGPAGPQLVVATDASPARVAGSSAFGRVPGAVAYIKSAVYAQSYRIEASPYLFAIDRGGIVRGHGTAESARDVRRLLDTLSNAGDAGPSSEASAVDLPLTQVE